MLLPAIQPSAYLANNGELETLRLSRKYVEQCAVNSPKSIVDAFIQYGQPETACHHTLSYVSSSPSSSPDGQLAAVRCHRLIIVLAHLVRLWSVVQVGRCCISKEHEPFSLLQVFLNSGLPELHSWLESHPAVLEKIWQKSTEHSLSGRSVFCHVDHWVLHMSGTICRIQRSC
ncbi:uncharacterized protein F5891DRAFT_1037633 [Suillus fuscotomentosus]|uniref:Uncharacterized protein n=1 Tax=Suillus fuscotomentosus TaxID=1912939 RepID=A0AAD4E4P0_9AGAM|nr:uncharacterized protein F5891DRAFT_1037633 [Suillus fuscotomentosus]KAG1899650.1 hypothetical protein F5891DRAFT_1037633 [Suillus fuscotomentosus]